MTILRNIVLFGALVSAIHWYITAGWTHEGMPTKLYDENTPSLIDTYKPMIDKTRNVNEDMKRDLDRRMEKVR